jgi:hypothetical protein
LKNAFDCVNYDILLYKLEFYGLIGNNPTSEIDVINNWHISFQMGRVNNIVPQVLIRRPLLFLLYINDLPNVISKSEPVLFADYTSIIITNSIPIDYDSNIIQIFKNINYWFKANVIDKTYFIQF